MCGDKKAGFSIFWADDGLDTGPILLQREVDVDPNDTVDSLYNRFLYPEGIKAMVSSCFVLYITYTQTIWLFFWVSLKSFYEQIFFYGNCRL